MSDKEELPAPDEAAEQIAEAMRLAKSVLAGDDVEGHIFENGEDLSSSLWSINAGCSCADA